MISLKNVALVVALVLAAISPAHAQSTAQISGTVTDTSGSVIPGATVVITNESTSIQTTAVSNAVGNYTALFLQPGTYRIDVSLDGFQPHEAEWHPAAGRASGATQFPIGSRHAQRDGHGCSDSSAARRLDQRDGRCRLNGPNRKPAGQRPEFECLHGAGAGCPRAAE